VIYNVFNTLQAFLRESIHQKIHQLVLEAGFILLSF